MFRRVPIDWRFVRRLAVMLLAETVLPVMGGIALDTILHTSPIVTLFMMLLGFNLGIFTIARSVGSVYAQVEKSPQTIQSHSVGGDSC